MLEKLGRIPESMKLLSSSVKNNPTHAASWVALANLYVRKGIQTKREFVIKML